MSYPHERSDFDNAAPRSAYFYYAARGDAGEPVGVLCQTSGHEFVRALQGAAGVRADGNWGPGTSRALSAALRAAHAPAELQRAADGVPAAGRVGPEALKAAVWLYLLRREGFAIDPASIALEDAAPPPYRRAARGVTSGHGESSCAASPGALAELPRGAAGEPVWQQRAHSAGASDGATTTPTTTPTTPGPRGPVAPPAASSWTASRWVKPAVGVAIGAGLLLLLTRD